MQFTRAAHHAKTLFTAKFAWKMRVAFWHHSSGRATMVFNPTRALGAPARFALSCHLRL